MKKIIKAIKSFFYYRIIYPIKQFNFKYDIIRPIQIFFRGYSYADWWSASSILSERMLPVLKNLRDNKRHGIPSIFFNDEKDRLIAMGYEWNENTQSFSDKKIDGKTAFNIVEEIWQNILNEICFALEYSANEEDDDCHVPNPLYNPNQKEPWHDEPCEDRPDFCKLVFHDDYGKTKIDMDLLQKKEERVQKGLELMGKYWMCLWD